MATIWATKAGNYSDPTVWNLGRVPASGDDVYFNHQLVTLDSNVICDKISNASASGINAGGMFYGLGASNITRTITCNRIEVFANAYTFLYDADNTNKVIIFAAQGIQINNCNFTYSGAPRNLEIHANIEGNEGTLTARKLRIYGNLTGSLTVSATESIEMWGNVLTSTCALNSELIYFSGLLMPSANNGLISGGNVIIVGDQQLPDNYNNTLINCSNGFSHIGNIYGNGGLASGEYVRLTGAGKYNSITGNIYGNKSSNTFGLVFQIGVNSQLNITGNVYGDIGKTVYIYDGNVTITGNVFAKENSLNPVIYANTITAGTTDLLGEVRASNTVTAVRLHVANSIAICRGNMVMNNFNMPVFVPENCKFKVSPESQMIILMCDTNNNLRSFATANVIGNNPVQSDVRKGVSFGVNNMYLGSLNVPDKSAVAYGIDVDNTKGEAVLTKQSLEESISSIVGAQLMQLL